MKIASFLLVLLATIDITIKAQNATVTMSMIEYEMAKARTDSLSSVIVKDQLKIDSLNNVVRVQDSIIVELKEQLKSISDMKRSSESVITTLKDSLTIQANEILCLKKEVAALDMVRLRYANGRLQLPYNQEKVNEAIELFNGISDKNLKNQCDEVLSWLHQYNFYLHDVQELIQSIQSDNRRENKFEFDEWRSDALKNLNQNRYIKDSKGHQFSILYLDDILSTARNRLTKSTKPIIDFSDLLERLQPR